MIIIKPTFYFLRRVSPNPLRMDDTRVGPAVFPEKPAADALREGLNTLAEGGGEDCVHIAAQVKLPTICNSKKMLTYSIFRFLLRNCYHNKFSDKSWHWCGVTSLCCGRFAALSYALLAFLVTSFHYFQFLIFLMVMRATGWTWIKASTTSFPAFKSGWSHAAPLFRYSLEKFVFKH